MGTFASIEEARAYFQNDTFATGNGMVLEEIGDHTAVASVVIGPGHKNANGGVMGGVIFTLADFAFAAATNQVHRPTVAMQVSINYLNSAKGGKLFATARCIKDGRTSVVYSVTVTDEDGREIALFTGTGFKL